MIVDTVDTLAGNAVRTLSKVSTYAAYGREHEAPLRPTALLSVDPMSITTIPVDKPRLPLPFMSGVEGGQWDLNTRKVADDVVYQSFVERFEQGRSWEDTAYHSFMQERLTDTSGEWKQYQELADIHQRYDRLDRLYQTIDQDGYRRQGEITNDQFVDFSNKTRGFELMLPPEFREISVYVARDGAFMWAAGMHRLCIAQLVGVKMVPVRIRLRHERWQHRRDAVYTGRMEPTDHPDIRQLG